MTNSDLHNQLATLITEQRNPSTRDIDRLSTREILTAINNEDKLVAHAVERELHHIAEAVEIIVEQLTRGGRLIYVGAGTSGRLGVLDATECPPTFGTDPSQVTGIIAGGQQALTRSIEGAEDDEKQAARDLDALHVTTTDIVCGIAASRRTPYVVAAIQRARESGAKTIFITTNPRAKFDLAVDVAICPEVGPEVIMGSTRMKSGTAQKLVLNMLTTATMIKLGKVFENMMVDLQLTNQKLLERARRIVMIAAGVEYETAKDVLSQAGGHVKIALVMVSEGVTAEAAQKKLEQAGGFVRGAIGSTRLS
jgi:N-acetylmuramic acid 6-phosphate etherase